MVVVLVLVGPVRLAVVVVALRWPKLSSRWLWCKLDRGCRSDELVVVVVVVVV